MFRFTVISCTAALIGSIASASIPTLPQGGSVSDGAVILAQTNGQERRDNRDDNRDERQDDRVDCRQEEGAGKDKRDCKQDERHDRVDGDASTDG